MQGDLIVRAIIYKNLNRGDWSLANPAGKSGLGRGKVFDHKPAVILTSAVFVVQESARVRVVSKRCREVHAWIVGDVVDTLPANHVRQEVTYNPYRCGQFTTRDGSPVTAAACVEFAADGLAYIHNPI